MKLALVGQIHQSTDTTAYLTILDWSTESFNRDPEAIPGKFGAGRLCQEWPEGSAYRRLPTVAR